MKRWLFLDIDGVLNKGSYTMGCAWIECRLVEQLNWLLEHVDHVVLSSDWRHQVLSGQMTLAGMHTLLSSHGIALTPGCCVWVEGQTGKLHGVTDAQKARFSSNAVMDRWHQIRRYVREHVGPEDRYVILDDLDLQQYGAVQFVRVSPWSGLTAQEVCRALAFLGVQL